MSESASAMSEEEEELDDMSLGIKTKPRSPRASPRRKSAAACSQPKRKNAAGRAVTEGAVAKGNGPATAPRVARATVGSSSHSGSSSDSSASDSSASRSSSGSGSGNNARAAVATRRGRNGRSKAIPCAAVQQARLVPRPQKDEREKEEKGQKEVVEIAKERGGQGRGKAGQRKERRQDDEGVRTVKLPEVRACV